MGSLDFEDLGKDQFIRRLHDGTIWKKIVRRNSWAEAVLVDDPENRCQLRSTPIARDFEWEFELVEPMGWQTPKLCWPDLEPGTIFVAEGTLRKVVEINRGNGCVEKAWVYKSSKTSVERFFTTHKNIPIDRIVEEAQ